MSKKAPTNEDLDAMFAGIGDGDSTDTTNLAHPAATTSSTTTSSGTSTKKPTPTSSKADDEDDPLAELANLAAAPRVSSTISRPQTPRTAPGGVRGKAESVVHTPTSTVASERTSEEKSRRSEEVASRSGAQAVERQTQAEAAVPVQPSTGSETGGGWGSWGGWASNLATAAVKQAQAAVAEVQKNEEANKWAEQVKGNVGALRGFGVSSHGCSNAL